MPPSWTPRLLVFTHSFVSTGNTPFQIMHVVVVVDDDDRWLFGSVRLLLGFGVGGEYPLSATITAESSGNSKRGQKVL